MSYTTMAAGVFATLLGVRMVRAFRDRNFRRYLWATLKEVRNMYYRYHV